MRKLLLIPLFLGILSLQAQETNSFEEEVNTIQKRNDSLWDATKETIVFTGSSSIRFWKDVQERFPKQQVLNSGFGGSQATDLLFHLDRLVLRYNPKKVFIYEGDNDVFARKRPKQIIATTTEIVKRLKTKNPEIQIVLISAKPSLSRWNLRGKYKRLNRKFLHMAAMDENLAFVDVWHIMLNGRKVREDIFIDDGLHMNEIGYQLWYNVIKDYVN